jgi:glycosyltransferase involved in cell wall biosynthesis
MKKIIFRGPVQTASGYGVHSRMLLKALDEDGRFDVTVMSVPWGATPLIYDDTPEMKRIKELATKFNPNGPQEYDASVQVTIPNEFMKMAPKNICVTAGIETHRVAALWQQKTNEVADVLVVPSIHSAKGFTTAIFGEQKGPQQLLLRKPLYILPEWVDTTVFNTAPSESSVDLSDMPDFNFITVGLGMDKADGEDRKNITNTIKWFCEQFRDNQQVGLVLKVSMVNASPLDFKNVRDRIRFIKAQAGCGQFPKIKLIHGRLSDQELAALYKHPKVKALVSLTHGEGYGLPIIEAAACGLPVVATNWSGHLDFLKIDGVNKFVPVDYELAPIPPSCVWKDVMDEGTKWANPKETDAKFKMTKLQMSYDKPKQWALELAEHIAKTFNKDLGKQWADDMYKLVSSEPVHLTKNVLVKTAKSDKKLENVTLVNIATNVGIDAALKPIIKSREQIGFGKVKLFVDKNITPEFVKTSDVEGVEIIGIEPFRSVAEHDTWVIRELPKYIDTDFFMTVQTDGYVLNGSAWTDEFLNYDLIGAPWTGLNVPIVGNMAMCIRSLRLAKELQNAEFYPETAPQDINVCVKYWPLLEAKGFTRAPVELASKFSVENLPYEGQFGWHGENPFNGER